jgi:spore coat polysaccharide biosynthesis protein SpsF
MYGTRPERIIATVQARMTSSRLPGKVLMPIGGKPALEMLLSRLKKSRYIDGISVATTINPEDDAVVACAKSLGADSFRGSELDVLGRLVGTAQAAKADIIVEITGDCPFVDPALVDRCIEEFFTHDVDYASNTIHATYPNGFDVQVFPTAILEGVERVGREPVYRTHPSYYIYTHQEKYRCRNWEAPEEAYGPELRMTLDEESDYRALCAVADALLPQHPDFSAGDVVQYLRAHPEVVALNASVRQKEPHEL